YTSICLGDICPFKKVAGVTMIAMIAAHAHQRVIGRAGQVPWHLPADSHYFQQTTLGKTVVMGRKTFESLDEPLTRRRNIVLSSDPTFQPAGAEVLHTKAAVLALHGDLWIIGGEQIYRLFLDVADRLYLTEIDLDVAGDTFFPAWDRAAFRVLSRREGVVDAQNPHPHTYFVYERIT
ncbi:MAG: dihydrofolate reductase, partial [Ktedonobacteraceae bacterium]